MVPPISVVMPVHNASDFLAEAIESTLSQTWSDFELIIVDDGSTDDSVEIIRRYRDGRIVFIPNTHQYIESLNIGMNRARGKYIARMDADDRMRPERLQVQYDYLENHPETGACGSWFQTFGSREETCKMPEDAAELASYLLVGNALCHPSTLIRRCALEMLSPERRAGVYRPDYIYAEDYKLWCDLVMNGIRLATVPQILLDYRCSDKQVTHVRHQAQQACTRKIQREFFEYATNSMIDREPLYYDAVNGLIRLYNADRLSFRTLMHILQPLYLGFLRTSGY